MDVEKLVCDEPGGDHPRDYKAVHPDAPEVFGIGETPEVACADLSKKASKPFEAFLRGASIAVKDGDALPGPELFRGQGSTPQEAWEACNKSKATKLQAEAKKLGG